MANVKGTYALVLALDEDTDITVGKLASFSFPRGYYVYVGSALGGLFPRVSRHIRGAGRLHWHVDYLRREARVVEVWYLASDERLECGWFGAVAGMPEASVPVQGFGSSGCRCRSHLAYFPSLPSFEAFRNRLGGKALDLKRMPVEGKRSGLAGLRS